MSDPGYRIRFGRNALKFLKSIEKAEPTSARQIAKKLQALEHDPYPPASKQLTGRRVEGRPVRRLRSGVYRVLYVVEKRQLEVWVLDIAHRRSVYRDLS